MEIVWHNLIARPPKNPCYTQRSRGYLIHKPSYSRFCRKFRCHGNGVWSWLEFIWHHSIAWPWKPPVIRNNLRDISHISRVIADFVPNFVAMATKVSCCNIWLTPFDSLTPKTPYQTQHANYSFKRQYLANGRRYVQSYYYWLIESWIALLTDTKTDDLELHKFEFLPNLTWFRRFSYAKNGYTNEYRPMSATSHWQYGLSSFVLQLLPPNLRNSRKIRTYSRLGSSKVIDLGAYRKHSHYKYWLWTISYRFRDTDIFARKQLAFLTSPLFDAP